MRRSPALLLSAPTASAGEKLHDSKTCPPCPATRPNRRSARSARSPSDIPQRYKTGQRKAAPNAGLEALNFFQARRSRWRPSSGEVERHVCPTSPTRLRQSSAANVPIGEYRTSRQIDGERQVVTENRSAHLAPDQAPIVSARGPYLTGRTTSVASTSEEEHQTSRAEQDAADHH